MRERAPKLAKLNAGIELKKGKQKWERKNMERSQHLGRYVGTLKVLAVPSHGEKRDGWMRDCSAIRDYIH